MTAKLTRTIRATQRTGDPVPATGLGLLVREAFMSWGRNFQALLAEHRITYAQWRHLWLLLRDGELSPVELSRRAGVKKASSTAIIDCLARRRLIRRAPDRTDRRRVNLSLTPAGIALMEAIAAASRILNAHARAGIADRDYLAMVATLRQAIANLDGIDPAALQEVVQRTTCPPLPKRRRPAAAARAAQRRRRRPPGI